MHQCTAIVGALAGEPGVPVSLAFDVSSLSMPFAFGLAFALVMRRADALATPVDWLLRSKHNRTLSGSDKLWSRVMASEPLGEIRFRDGLAQGPARP